MTARSLDRARMGARTASAGWRKQSWRGLRVAPALMAVRRLPAAPSVGLMALRESLIVARTLVSSRWTAARCA
eukprot:748834-Alexandrium_andersonii.AAC.1